MFTILARAAVLVTLLTLAACGPKTKAAVAGAKAAVTTCAKDTANRLVAQAEAALLDAAGKDPHSVTAFLDALALDAAQAGVTDAIGFVDCVAAAAKAKLADLAKTASMDPQTYALILGQLDSWTAAHSE